MLEDHRFYFALRRQKLDRSLGFRAVGLIAYKVEGLGFGVRGLSGVTRFPSSFCNQSEAAKPGTDY